MTSIDHPIVLRELRVSSVADPTPWLRRITLTGSELGAFERDGRHLNPFRSTGPDDHVKIFLATDDATDPVLPAQDDGHLDWPDDPRPLARDYTVRRFDAAAGELCLEFVLHGHGTAARWAQGVAAGVRLHVAGPRSSHLYPATGHLVLFGDPTAVPALGRWVEELDGPTSVVVGLEIDDDWELPTLAAPAGVTVEVRRRSTADGGLAALARTIDWQPDTFVFGAGEFASIGALRSVMADSGVPAERRRLVSYWRRAETADSALDADNAAYERLADQADLLTPYAIRVAATIGLADAVAAGVTQPGALAERTGSDPAVLNALCAHLVRSRILDREADGALSLSDTGLLLVSDDPSGMRERLRLDGGEGHLDHAWSGLLHAVRTGRPGFDAVYGRPFWDEIKADPYFAASFDEHLAEWAAYWVSACVESFDWSAHSHVLDVGGGSGLVLAELVAAQPHLRGTLLELPTAVAAASERFAERGIADRATAIVGDFFEPLPQADVVLYAQVLHDWPHHDARRILQQAARAVGPTGHVVLVERGEDGETATGASVMSLLMMNLFAATERTIDEYQALAASAGLRLAATTPLIDPLVLMDFVPAEHPVIDGPHI